MTSAGGDDIMKKVPWQQHWLEIERQDLERQKKDGE